MSDYVLTTETIRVRFADAYGNYDNGLEDFNRWLAAHDAEVVSVERERVIQDMQERSHPDDWGVPCIYVKSYADRLRGEAS